jgi:hypothetical protein
MNLYGIAERISDLLKLKGFSNFDTVEDLTDHYLSHIEEEIIRGVNSQKAVRETFQEIALLDSTSFTARKKNHSKTLIFLLAFVLLGGLFYFFSTHNYNSTKITTRSKIAKLHSPSKNHKITPTINNLINQVNLTFNV